ncbi:hypothetical protein E2C01_009166 [Portunus trituberculatus]|uniref:Uncharacterized protein n=1 Tax=Portunus trituberculatus TaxID=210409 RepID=A0A5B7D5Q1_PORTR|nr:hypothetical protein [Portunus trituberculatus]
MILRKDVLHKLWQGDASLPEATLHLSRRGELGRDETLVASVNLLEGLRAGTGLPAVVLVCLLACSQPVYRASYARSAPSGSEFATVRGWPDGVVRQRDYGGVAGPGRVQGRVPGLNYGDKLQFVGPCGALRCLDSLQRRENGLHDVHLPRGYRSKTFSDAILPAVRDEAPQ